MSVILNVTDGDDESLLVQSIRSVVQQSRPANQLIVVIDGPIHSTLDRLIQVETASVVNLSIVRSREQRGLARARNLGFHHSTAEFVALQDADDRMHPERLRVGLGELVRSGADIFCSGAVEFDVRSELILGVRASPVNLERCSRSWFWNNPVSHSTVIVRRTLVLGVGGYRSVSFAEDYDLWIRLTCAGATWISSPLALQALGIDDEHYLRRGGWRFIRTEFHLHRELGNLSRRSFPLRCTRLLVRLILRLGPQFMRVLSVRFALRRPTVLEGFSVGQFMRESPSIREAGVLD